MNCSKVCDCYNGAPCHHIHGSCECQAGFRGDKVAWGLDVDVGISFGVPSLYTCLSLCRSAWTAAPRVSTADSAPVSAPARTARRARRSTAPASAGRAGRARTARSVPAPSGLTGTTAPVSATVISTTRRGEAGGRRCIDINFLERYRYHVTVLICFQLRSSLGGLSVQTWLGCPHLCSPLSDAHLWPRV